MISRQIDTLEHSPCQCGRAAKLMEVHMPGGAKRYKAEAICCHMQTVMLRTPHAAAAEFNRLRAVLVMDEVATNSLQEHSNVSHIRGRK